MIFWLVFDSSEFRSYGIHLIRIEYEYRIPHTALLLCWRTDAVRGIDATVERCNVHIQQRLPFGVVIL